MKNVVLMRVVVRIFFTERDSWPHCMPQPASHPSQFSPNPAQQATLVEEEWRSGGRINNILNKWLDNIVQRNLNQWRFLPRLKRSDAKTQMQFLKFFPLFLPLACSLTCWHTGHPSRSLSLLLLLLLLLLLFHNAFSALPSQAPTSRLNSRLCKNAATQMRWMFDWILYPAVFRDWK